MTFLLCYLIWFLLTETILVLSFRSVANGLETKKFTLRDIGKWRTMEEYQQDVGCTFLISFVPFLRDLLLVFVCLVVLASFLTAVSLKITK